MSKKLYGGLIDEDECVDLDFDELEEKEERQKKEKSKGKPIHERERKNKQKLQLSFFDFMEDITEQDDKEKKKEWLIKRELKCGSKGASGKMRICHEYAKNPTVGEFSEFLKREYGWGGCTDGEYDSNYNPTGMILSWRDKKTKGTIIEVNLKWNEVAYYVADLIDDDEYLTTEEKIEFENYQAQRYGSNEDRIRAIVDWMVEYGTRYARNGHYNNYSHGDNFGFVKEHISEIQTELESRAEVEKVGYAEMDGFNVDFKPVYCRCFVKEFYEAGVKLRAMKKGKEMEM